MKTFGLLLTIVGTVFFLLWGTVRIVAAVQTGRKCTAHLKRAADANTIELAKKELDVAIKYIEKHDLTKGSTAILWDTPATDLGFWYENLKASVGELDALSPEASGLEKTNMLMKLRETLVDQGQDGIKVTRPGGISVFPHNTAYCVWSLVSFVLLFTGAVMWLIAFHASILARYDR